MTLRRALVWLVIAIMSSGPLVASARPKRSPMAVHSRNPFFQHLPRCDGEYTRVRKKTTATALVCPMIRDESGFLSEWIAYYEMQGFDHVRIYDHKSRETYDDEIRPWLASGFVSVVTNFTIESLGGSIAPKDAAKNKWRTGITLKALAEMNCKEWGSERGFNYFMSVDLDEYAVSSRADESVVDALERFFSVSNRSYFGVIKRNFIASPHILEPVNLLTIEAYQVKTPLIFCMHVCSGLIMFITLGPQ